MCVNIILSCLCNWLDRTSILLCLHWESERNYNCRLVWLGLVGGRVRFSGKRSTNDRSLVGFPPKRPEKVFDKKIQKKKSHCLFCVITAGRQSNRFSIRNTCNNICAGRTTDQNVRIKPVVSESIVNRKQFHRAHSTVFFFNNTITYRNNISQKWTQN